MIGAGGPWYKAFSLSAARLVRRSRRAFANSALSRTMRLPPPHETLVIAPADLHTTDPVFGEELLSGRFALAGTVVHSPQANVFMLDPPNRGWFEALHGFQWLRHVAALKYAAGQTMTRQRIEHWMASPHGAYNDASWIPPLLTMRLVAWLNASPAILTGADTAFYRRFTLSLLRQARHLLALHPHLEPGLDRLNSAIALSMVGLSLKGQKRLTKTAGKLLATEIRRQIGPDGGHISRNPTVIVELLSHLLPLQMLYSHRGEPVPSSVPKAIERMMAYLRLVRHADGALATFNGASAVPQELIASILVHAEERSEVQPIRFVGGYARMEAGDAVLIADCGRAPPAFSREVHAGATAFEFSAAQQRLIVNCGSPILAREQWAKHVRVTAAHNTLTINDQSSTRINSAGYILRPAKVKVTPSEADGPRLTLEHDGYKTGLGAICRRILTLSTDGALLAGYERVEGAKAGTKIDCRFHIHPLVQVFQADGLDGFILSPPSGPEWIFRADMPFEVQESVFVSGPEGPRRTLQIVVSGEVGADGFTLSWSLLRDTTG